MDPDPVVSVFFFFFESGSEYWVQDFCLYLCALFLRAHKNITQRFMQGYGSGIRSGFQNKVGSKSGFQDMVGSGSGFKMLSDPVFKIWSDPVWTSNIHISTIELLLSYLLTFYDLEYLMNTWIFNCTTHFYRSCGSGMKMK